MLIKTKEDFDKAKEKSDKGNVLETARISDYYNSNKDYENAYKWAKLAASKGDARSMFNLATCYENGTGTEKNLKEAFKWYEKGAEKEHPLSMYNLAKFYERGIGTEVNSSEAIKWFKKASRKNLDFALLCVEDIEKFLENEKNAKNNDADAIFNLALCYESGRGINVDIDKAVELFKKASDLGNKEALKAYKYYIEP